MVRLTASVVGGGMGGKLSLQALNNSEKYDLVAIADLRPDVTEQISSVYPGVKTFLDHETMFSQCPTDVVCVSTYPPSHEEVALAALRMPGLRGILVEKPIGHTVISARRTIQAIKGRGIPLVTPHGLLAKNTPLEVIERVHNHEIGELKLVEIQCTKWDIINAGIHWLNFFVRLTRNEPMKYVMAISESSTKTFRDGMQVETTAVTYAETASGIRVVMNTGDEVTINRNGKDTLFRIVGTAGQIEFWGWENGYRLLNAAHPNGDFILPQEFQITGHQRYLENLYDQIFSRVFDYTVPDSSLMALEICEGAYLSSAHRCKVLFPVDKFIPPQEPEWEPGKPYSGVGGGRDGRKL